MDTWILNLLYKYYSLYLLAFFKVLDVEKKSYKNYTAFAFTHFPIINTL